MGYTFAAALFRKTGTAPATRKVLRESMESMGYRRAASAEEASLSLHLYQHKKSSWLCAALDMPEDLDKELDFLRALAAGMHTSILYFMNFDSDLLFIAATDGVDVQHVHVGYCEEDDLPPDSDNLSLFDQLLADDAARAEFRRILAVDEEERIFSESAAEEMAPLFGYTPEVLFTDEDTPIFAELNFDLPGEEAVPFLMAEDAPPAFTKELALLEWGNPACLAIHPCGGTGKGIRVLMRAEGYDDEDWEAECVQLSNVINKNMGHPAPLEYQAKALPKRVAFQDGSKGWMVDFPEAPIFRGVNPKSPMARSQRADAIYTANGYSLYLAFTGGTFSTEDLNFTEKTYIWVVPMENPAGAINHSIPRSPIRDIKPWWLESNNESE